MFRNNIKSSWNRSNVFGRKVVYVPQSRIADLCTTTSVAACPDGVKEPNNVADVNAGVGKTTNDSSLLGVGGQENILSTTDPNNTVVQNSDIEELSANEKRAAKRRKQKESKLGYNAQKSSGDSLISEGALKYSGLEQNSTKDSVEIVDDQEETKKHQNRLAVITGVENKDVVENDSGFGDWNRHETLGLASVKSGLITPTSELSEDSENGKNLSECSEVISPSELDSDDILRSLVTDRTTGNGFENVCIGIGNLPNTLDQRSSVTDSSGVETSSDADSDHAMYVMYSADQKSDVPNGGQRADLHQPEDSACEQEAEFITVSKKRKPKSLQVDGNARNVPSLSSTGFLSPDSGESSPQQEQTVSISQSTDSTCRAGRPAVHKECAKLPENSLSLGSTTVDCDLCFASPRPDTSFDAGHQPGVNFSVPPERNSSAKKHNADHNSMYLDNFSGRASLSDISLDDFEWSYLLKETLEDDWTVVKNGRRPRNNVQSAVNLSSAAGENKQSVPISVGQCSTSVARDQVASEHGRGKAGSISGRGKWSTQNSRCKSFDGSNSKAFNHCWRDNGTKSRSQEANQKNFCLPRVARCSSSTEPKYRDTNCDSSSRCNSNKEFALLESNPVPARCQEIPRFSQKSTVPKYEIPMKNDCAVVANYSEGAKTALTTMTAEPGDDRARRIEGLSSEKTCLSTEFIKKSAESSNSKLPVADNTFIRDGTFNLIEAQIYLYREYQEVLKERQKIPHLVVIYDQDSEL